MGRGHPVCARVLHGAHVCIRAYLIAHIHVYTHMYMYGIYARVLWDADVCMHPFLHTYTHTYIHAYTHTCMHTHIGYMREYCMVLMCVYMLSSTLNAAQATLVQVRLSILMIHLNECIYTHIHIKTHIHTYIHRNMHTNMNKNIHTYIDTYTCSHRPSMLHRPLFIHL